jgi:AraC-like DNA-binding protein
LTLKKQIETRFSPDPFSKITTYYPRYFIFSVNSFPKTWVQKRTFEIADLLYSKSTFDKKLENELIKNISQYIREFKLDYAIKLINLGERNIYLADETGFNSFRIFLLVLRIIKVLLLPIISNLVDNNFSKVTF